MSMALRTTAVLAACALAAMVWVWLDLQRDRWSMERAQAGTDNVRRMIEQDLNIRLSGSAVLQDLQNVTFTSAESMARFETRAARILNAFPGILAVGLMDADSTIRALYPQRFPGMKGERASGFGSDRAAALERMQRDKTVTFVAGITLANTNSHGFVAFKPLLDDGELTGFMVLAFESDAWLKNLMFAEEMPEILKKSAIKITLDSAEIIQSPDFDTGGDQTFTSTGNVFGTAITIQTQPHWNAFGTLWASTPEILAALIAVLTMAAITAAARTRDARAARAQSLQIANDLRDLNRKLYVEIEERRGAEEKAQEAQKMMASFLATMSHEVRTPLNAIMGMFELIERGETSERAKRQAKAGRSAAQRLFAELTNVLDVSRLDAHAVEIAPGAVNLPGVCRQWSETLEALVENAHKDIGFVVDIAPEITGSAVFDAVRVTQIVTNLLDNAVKFTSSGKIRLAVSKSGTDLFVSVSDTGTGIPKERRDIIFTRFYQIDSGLNRRYDGAGLGLAICKELSTLMGFELSLEPDLNAQYLGDTNLCKVEFTGSTFSLKLCNVVTDAHPINGPETELSFEHAHSSSR